MDTEELLSKLETLEKRVEVLEKDLKYYELIVDKIELLVRDYHYNFCSTDEFTELLYKYLGGNVEE